MCAHSKFVVIACPLLIDYKLISYKHAGGFDMRCNDGSVKGFILPSIDIYPIISQPLGFKNISGFTGAIYHILYNAI